MDRRTALEVLGLHEGSSDALDPAAVKRRFRALARDRHPDLGGDPADFHALHAAYEVLRVGSGDATERPADPGVARGRPSRSDDPTSAARRLDADALDATASALAGRIAVDGTARSLSRAPGARTNRLAASLAVGTTSTLDLVLGGPRTPGGPRTVHIELTGRGRAARRALSALDLLSVEGAAWARRRGDAVTVVEADLAAGDVEAVSRRAAAATARLLAALAWPLDQWRPVGHRN